jgi:hypothetical protein
MFCLAVDDACLTRMRGRTGKAAFCHSHHKTKATPQRHITQTLRSAILEPQEEVEGVLQQRHGKPQRMMGPFQPTMVWENQ